MKSKNRRRKRDSSFSQHFPMLHDACIDAVDTMLELTCGRFGSASEMRRSGNQDATELLLEVESLGSHARCVDTLFELHSDRLMREGHQRKWECQFYGEIEPGAHAALARFLRTYFVESMNAHKVFGERDNPSDPNSFQPVPPAYVVDEAALNERLNGITGALPLIDVAFKICDELKRLRFLLTREAYELGHATKRREERSGGLLILLNEDRLKARDGASSPRATRSSIVIDHGLRRVYLKDGNQPSMQLTSRQMDLLLLMVFARRRNESFRTHDLKKLGAIGNPSEVFRRLPEEIRKLIESGPKGRRLKCDVQVIDEELLSCGRRIDWKKLEVAELGMAVSGDT